MKQLGFALALLSVAAICSGQQPSDFKPAETNVWGAENPNGRCLTSKWSRRARRSCHHVVVARGSFSALGASLERRTAPSAAHL